MAEITRNMTAKEQFEPKSATAKALGERVYACRRRANKSVAQMIEPLKCSVNRYRMGEAGASPFRSDELLTIAAVLEIDAAELLAIDPAIEDRPAE